MIKSNISGVQATQAALKAEIDRIQSGAQYVLVGFPEGSGSYDTGETIAGVAAANEFGTSRIPARPFLQPGVNEGLPEYNKIIQDMAQEVTDGKISMSDVLEAIGVTAAAKVKEYIINLSSPPNAPGTVRAKKSSNPLIDTGAMVQAVTHVLSEEKPQEGI